MKTIVIALALLMVYGSVSAQYTNLRFENLSTIDGLSSSTCVDIFQDREGFIWFATIDGLNKYDGYDFTIFRSFIDDPYSLSSNRISSITEDSVGTLWIGTGNGLNAFDKNAEKFVRISHDRNNPFSIGSDFIYQLLFDSKRNRLWAATKDGVSALSLNDISVDNLKKLKFQRYHSVKNNPLTLDHNEATSIAQDAEGKIWVVTAGSNLNLFDEVQNKFVQVPVNASNPYHMDHIPKSLLIDKDGNFWIGNNLAGLTFWDRKKNEFSVKRLVERTTPIFQIFQDNSGVIWCATDGYGMYFIDKDKGVTDHIVNNPSNPYSLSNNQPSSILEDRNGIFWIATYNTGVNKLIRSKSAFGYYYHQPDNANSLSHKIAQSVLEDNDGHIWIGTDGGGLNLFNEEKNTFKHFKHDPGNPASISGNKIIYMCPSYKGLWVCTWQAGISLLNTATGKFKSYKHDPGNSFSLSQNSIWCALEDKQHRLWAGTQSTGLNMFDPTTEKFYHFTSVPQDTSTLLNNFVLSLLIDSRNRLIVGTAIGLNVADLNSTSTPIDKLDFRRIKGTSLLGNRINSLIEDHQGNIWVGSDLGLITLTPELQLHRTYTTKDGLPNNLITGIQQDNQHNIWVTTKSGLSQLDLGTHKFKNYNTHDGLQGMEFQSKAIDKMKDGRIIIGGLNGFNIFDPAMVLADTVPPRLILTRFALFNKNIKPKDTVNNRVIFTGAIADTKSIELYHDEDHISFEFLALNYKNPEKNEYAYRMVGLDKDWNYVGNKRNTSYTNLAPGDYRFEVMASQDGTWRDKNIVSLAITILPPPWETWWAFLIYIVLIGFIVWMILKYYAQRVRDEREHELDQMKLSFFTNVSHEFRTPLTLILNPIEKILSSYANPEEVKNSAFIIQRSARRLMSLVNQLLDFRKTDLGKAPLETVPGDILKFSRDIFVLFNDMAEIKKINFTFDSDLDALPASFDPDKVEKILTNILSNAIKFTEPGGSITLSITKVPNPSKIFSKGSKDFVEFKIRDTGTGLKTDQLKHVFEPFFHVDNSKTGTGIGLHFTKSLVELHQGIITVESEYQKGSTFTISLPLHPKRTKPVGNANNLDKYAFDSIAIQSIEYELAINNGVEENSDGEPQQLEELKPVVLIVEDNRELRLHLKNELRNQFKVREATNGAEGFEKVMKYFPDVVISDIMMPEMDGFELCRKIKTDIETSHIPVVLLTARSLEEDKIEGYRTGADEYLAKPFNIHVLRARLKNLLEARERLKKKFMSSSNLLPAKEVTTNSMDEAFLDKATKVVLENISDPDFSLDDFLEKLAVSRSYFSRKINSLTGQNPSNFIRTIRLKYAASLLVQDQNTIKEIGFMSGFNSPAYFSKTFKELFGKTPQEYRENPTLPITDSTHPS
jgi:signal transduction histidine kinase/ligand-binding sensor domain-containing protein/DNA-binding response OmpR family regulator